MIASLPMYDVPRLRPAIDAWWAAIASALIQDGVSGVPAHLDRRPDYPAVWRRSDLLISQTCGYPLTHEFKDTLQVVAVPIYDCQGCEGPDYSSAIVVRAHDRADQLEDLRGRCAAFNSPDSLSGHLALRCVFAPLAVDGRFFGRTVRSGSHQHSLELVCAGAADVAAIDCVSLALARRHQRELCDGLRVICFSPLAPALPYVTRANMAETDVSRLRKALARVSCDPKLAVVRSSLYIDRLEFVTTAAYHRVLQLEAQAETYGLADFA